MHFDLFALYVFFLNMMATALNNYVMFYLIVCLFLFLFLFFLVYVGVITSYKFLFFLYFFFLLFCSGSLLYFSFIWEFSLLEAAIRESVSLESQFKNWQIKFNTFSGGFLVPNSNSPFVGAFISRCVFEPLTQNQIDSLLLSKLTFMHSLLLFNYLLKVHNALLNEFGSLFL